MSSINQVFIKVGTAEKDHPWYECTPDGKCEEMPHDPEAFPRPGILDVTVPRDTAVVLYRRSKGGLILWGVSWGRTPLDLDTSQDRMGRFMQFRLLVEFHSAKDAVDFCAGVLDEWWQQRAKGITELGQKARQALESRENIVPAYLEDCLRHWQGYQPQTRAGGDVAGDERLHVKLQPDAEGKQKELQELCEYLRARTYGFLDSTWVRQPSPKEGEVQHAVVVTTSVVVSRLHNVWRAMTDQALTLAWGPYPPPTSQRPGHDQANTSDKDSKQKGFLGRGADALGKLWSEADEVRQGSMQETKFRVPSEKGTRAPATLPPMKRPERLADSAQVQSLTPAQDVDAPPTSPRAASPAVPVAIPIAWSDPLLLLQALKEALLTGGLDELGEAQSRAIALVHALGCQDNRADVRDCAQRVLAKLNCPDRPSATGGVRHPSGETGAGTMPPGATI